VSVVTGLYLTQPRESITNVQNVKRRPKMEAAILPLEGKYYGTKIVIEDGEISTIIKIWSHGDFAPSDRELDNADMSREEYNTNKNDEKEEIDTSGGHFESQWTYKLAEKICQRLTWDD
jgi:hypothetical protein